MKLASVVIVAGPIFAICSGCSKPTNSAENMSSINSAMPSASPAMPKTDRPHYQAKNIDFSFAENAIRYKADVADSINDILANNPNCADIDPDTLVSASEASSRNPSLQIVCKTPQGQEFAVKFNAKDAMKGKTAPPIAAISRSLAVSICAATGREKAHVGSSIDLLDAEYLAFPNGNALVQGRFATMDGGYRVICHYRGAKLTDANAELVER